MVFDERGVLPIHVCVILRTHVAAAAPCLVAYGKIRNVPRFVAPVAATEVSEIRVSTRGHVLDPVHHLLWRAAANVAVDVWVSTKHLTQFEELVRAEGIGVHAAPARVGPSRTLVPWTNAVAPVVLVSETAAGPAQHRYM